MGRNPKSVGFGRVVFLFGGGGGICPSLNLVLNTSFSRIALATEGLSPCLGKGLLLQGRPLKEDPHPSF